MRALKITGVVLAFLAGAVILCAWSVDGDTKLLDVWTKAYVAQTQAGTQPDQARKNVLAMIKADKHVKAAELHGFDISIEFADGIRGWLPLYPPGQDFD